MTEQESGLLLYFTYMAIFSGRPTDYYKQQKQSVLCLIHSLSLFLRFGERNIPHNCQLDLSGFIRFFLHITERERKRTMYDSLLCNSLSLLLISSLYFYRFVHFPAIRLLRERRFCGEIVAMRNFFLSKLEQLFHQQLSGK